MHCMICCKGVFAKETNDVRTILDNFNFVSIAVLKNFMLIRKEYIVKRCQLMIQCLICSKLWSCCIAHITYCP